MRGLRSFVVLLVVALGLGAYLYFVESKKTPGDEASKEKAFTVEADKIEEVSLKSESGERTVLRKSGSDWQIAQPVAAAPDAAEVSGLTSSLASVEIQRVVEENPANPGEFGLAPPRIEVTFKAAGQPHTLHIGNKTPSGNDLYARTAATPRVFLIPSYLESTFNKGTFDLRDKSVLKVDVAKTDSLEVVTGDRTLKFEKKEGEWAIAAPIAARADYGSVDALVSRIGSSQMKSIVAVDTPDLKQYGLDKPSATVRIGTGSSQASLLFGSKADEGTVYAKDAARPAVFTVESALVDELRKDASEYRQKDLFDARPYNATRIEVTRGSQAVAFEKTKIKDKDGKEQETWKQVAPAAKDIDADKVESFLSVATNARALGFVAGSTKTNLENPEMTIVVRFDQGKEDRVSFSRVGADGYAQRAGSPGAATVDIGTIDSILREFEAIK